MRERDGIIKKVHWDKSGPKSNALHINAALTIVCAYTLWGGLQGLSLGVSGAWQFGLLGVFGLYGAGYRWLQFIDLYTDWDK